jgi:hypothetical protein
MNQAPIEYPRVCLEGIPYIFKYSLASVRFAKEHGIEDHLPGTELLDQIRYISEQAAVCAHTIAANGGLTHAGLLPEQMEAMIGVPEMGAISAAIVEASGKVRPVETSPSPQPAPVQ